MRKFAVMTICLLALAGCQREKRTLRPSPVRLAIFGDAARESTLIPGGSQPAAVISNPDEGNAYAISEGQRLMSGTTARAATSTEAAESDLR
jgi:cytochrome c oxidase cbb3-type subunit 3